MPIARRKKILLITHLKCASQVFVSMRGQQSPRKLLNNQVGGLSHARASVRWRHDYFDPHTFRSSVPLIWIMFTRQLGPLVRSCKQNTRLATTKHDVAARKQFHLVERLFARVRFENGLAGTKVHGLLRHNRRGWFSLAFMSVLCSYIFEYFCKVCISQIDTFVCI